MSSLAQALETPIQPESVTTISAIARVDYIFRFSKQAVMVVDEQITLCSSVGSQFLSNLPPEQNAAYITMSAKLNDLQVRCRIIEQLFGNTLFDPEQSVAVSLINLVKKHKQAVSIVIDNAHLLSLQLTHELCQLAEIAKKSEQQINILMLSTPLGGLKVSQNQSLFHKKLSIISAQTGQLVSHNSKQFKPQINYLSLTPLKKWLIFFLCLSIIAAGSMYLLFKRDVFSFSKVINDNAEVQTAKEKSIAGGPSEKFVLDNTKVSLEELNIQPASVNDIYISLVGKVDNKVTFPTELPEKAEPVDIMNAIEALSMLDNKVEESEAVKSEENTKDVGLTDDHIISDELTVHQINELSQPTDVETSQTLITSLSDKGLTENNIKNVSQDLTISKEEVSYFQNQQQGFVIQIAGFTQKSVLDEFLADFKQLPFFQYQRFVNNETMTILTTEHFATRELAELAYSQLPQSIKDRSPWIKTISSINDEINFFERSQSDENQVTIPAS